MINRSSFSSLMSKGDAKVKKQKTKDKKDESLGVKNGKEKNKKQTYASRRKESYGAKRKKV
jgi:hypothetical protein|tara:strand:+ start:3427 stop:3609 length:183 start_codon:yes stop_codon:yes gene_type:complete